MAARRRAVGLLRKVKDDRGTDHSREEKARQVLWAVRELGRPWGSWLSATCAALIEFITCADEGGPTNQDDAAQALRLLHEGGCPCTCARAAPAGAVDDGGADA